MKKILFSIRVACFVLLGAAVFSGNSAVNASAATQVKISKKNFPDALFRKHVKKFDKNKNGYLSKKEIRAVKELKIENGASGSYSKYSNAPMLDMKGMEYFTNVQKIKIDWYHLKNFDTGKMKNLKDLNMTECYQKVLDLRKNKKLSVLHLSGNNVTKIQFASPEKLTFFTIYHEKKLKKPDFSTFKNLETLQLDGMPYQSLDLRKCKKLNKFNCTDGSLKKLTVGKDNTKLKTMFIARCKLTSIDVSKLKNLEELSIEQNSLKTLDVTKNAALKGLYCDENNLTTLDVSKNSSLEELYCSENALKSIDVSKNGKLKYLSCAKNNLTLLNVSQNTELHYLNCSENNIDTLDLSQNSKLESLYCSKNPLRSLDVSMLAQLSYLDCKDCKLTTLKIPSNKNLIVYSEGNPLK